METMALPKKTRELHNHHSIQLYGMISNSAMMISLLLPMQSLVQHGCSKLFRN